MLNNRRHVDAPVFAVTCAHAAQVLRRLLAFGPAPPALPLLSADINPWHLSKRVLIPFGLAALPIPIYALIAATSYDWRLAFLTPPGWKALHMLVYAAYTMVVLRVGSALQSMSGLILSALVAASAVPIAVF